jgi:hypothetical protein
MLKTANRTTTAYGVAVSWSLSPSLLAEQNDNRLSKQDDGAWLSNKAIVG